MDTLTWPAIKHLRGSMRRSQRIYVVGPLKFKWVLGDLYDKGYNIPFWDKNIHIVTNGYDYIVRRKWCKHGEDEIIEVDSRVDLYVGNIWFSAGNVDWIGYDYGIPYSKRDSVDC